MGFFSQLGNMMRVLFTPITVIKSCSHLGQQCKCEQQYVGLVSTWVLLKNFYRSLVLVLGPGLISMKHELPPSLPGQWKGGFDSCFMLGKKASMAMASQVWAHQELEFGLKPPIGLKLVRHQPKWMKQLRCTLTLKNGWWCPNGKHFLVLFLNHSYLECLPMHTNHQHASTYLLSSHDIV